MHWLMMTLAAPRASFGGPAPGGVRATERAPTRSALLGLVACALGLPRTEHAAHAELAQALSFACRVEQDGRLEVDYHTAQVGKKTDLKKRVLRTRADELALPRTKLSTILSERSYRCDYRATVAICGVKEQLEGIAEALRKPRWALYLGRKCSPLAWPLAPTLIEAESWQSALAAFDAKVAADQATWRTNKAVRGLWWPLQRSATTKSLHSMDQRLAEARGVLGSDFDKRKVTRRTELLDRSRWLFSDTSVVEFEEKARG